MKIYEKNGVEFTEPELPSDHVVVAEYVPQSCPWDVYGNRFLQEHTAALQHAGIEAKPLTRHARILHPHGSGPGGRIRFGDDMMPGTYWIAVLQRDLERALAALETHRQAVTDWINNQAPRPAYLPTL